MVAIHLIFWLLILSFNGTAKRLADDETLKKLLKELIEINNSQDDQVMDSEALELFADYDELNDNAEHSLSLCGKPEIEPDINQKIVNGKPARPHSWPWQVRLEQTRFNGTHELTYECGGSIITNKIVLTAAHCVGNDKSEINVYAGVHILGKYLQRSNAKHIIIHDLYSETYFMNDIAILIMETPFIFTKEISPVCLPTKNLVAEGTCFATGWGDTNGTGNDNILNQVQLSVVEEDVCGIFNTPITRGHLCASGYDKDKGICHGDSGGPFVCLNDDDKWYLHGIASFVLEGCRTLSVFTNVVYFLDWIGKNTGLPIQ